MRLSLTAFLLGCLLSAGCGGPAADVAQPATEGPAGSGTPADNASGTPADADANRIEVQVASWDEVEQKIKGLEGRVAVVDLWATW